MSTLKIIFIHFANGAPIFKCAYNAYHVQGTLFLYIALLKLGP